MAMFGFRTPQGAWHNLQVFIVLAPHRLPAEPTERIEIPPNTPASALQKVLNDKLIDLANSWMRAGRPADKEPKCVAIAVPEQPFQSRSDNGATSAHSILSGATAFRMRFAQNAHPTKVIMLIASSRKIYDELEMAVLDNSDVDQGSIIIF